MLTLKPKTKLYKLKTKYQSGGKGWNHASFIGKMKINSKMAEMLNPWMYIHTETHTFLYKKTKQTTHTENYN